MGVVGDDPDEEGGVGIHSKSLNWQEQTWLYQGMLIPTVTMEKMSAMTSSKSHVFDFYLDVPFVAQGPLQWLTHVEH